MEKSLAPASVYFTWVDPDSWRHYTRAAYGAGMPFPVSYVVPYAQRRAVNSHFGVRHSREALLKDVAECYQALEAHLIASGGPFLLGPKPSSLDAFAFSHLLYHRSAPVCLPLQPELDKHEVRWRRAGETWHSAGLSSSAIGADEPCKVPFR